MCLSVVFDSLSYSFRVSIRVMVFNATFNNISVISWESVLLMEETGENHIMLSRIHHTTPRTEFEQTTLVVIGTDCTGSEISWKSNYHMITATTYPYINK